VPTGQADVVGAAWVFLSVAAIMVLTVVAVWLFQRGLAKEGGRPSAAVGDGLGNLIDVFHPAQARATRDLAEQRNQGPVTPTPDPDPDDPLQIELGPGGVPRRVRIRRGR
jgi:hypothetical protein